jgi:DUF2934 family protein
MARRADPFTTNLDASENGNSERIAFLAYLYWQARGCPHGSPEEDWFRAEEDLRPVPLTANPPRLL